LGLYLMEFVLSRFIVRNLPSIFGCTGMASLRFRMRCRKARKGSYFTSADCPLR
jgi:hypothetical protein